MKLKGITFSSKQVYTVFIVNISLATPSSTEASSKEACSIYAAYGQHIKLHFSSKPYSQSQDRVMPVESLSRSPRLTCSLPPRP